MPEIPCKQPALEQISTGQAGPEVNRDLEQLFRAVNKLIRCVSKASDFIDASSGGAFGGGSGSGTGGGTGGEPGTGTSPAAASSLLITTTGSNITLPDAFNGYAYIQLTADVDIVLGLPAPGVTAVIQHTGGAFTATVKDDLGNTIGTLTAGQMMVNRVFMDTSGVPTWNTGATAVSQSGITYVPDDVVFRAGSPVTKDTIDAHYVEHVITADVMVPNDTGTTSEPT